MAHDVFVSYPNADKAIADAVANHLETNGIRCWIAPRDVPRGADWAGSIINAIETCRLEVLVFSDATNDSDHILREVRAAGDNNIPILPFRTTDQQPNAALRYYIGGTHWLDALTDDLDHHLTELTTSVRAILGETAGAATAASVVPPRPPTVTAPPPPDTWWTRFPARAKIGAAVAVALVVIGGIVISTTGSDDTRTAAGTTIAVDGATVAANDEPAPESAEADTEMTDEESAVTPGESSDDASGSDVTATEPGTDDAAGPSDSEPDDGPWLRFALANAAGPNQLCVLESSYESACEAIDDDRWTHGVAAGDFDGDGRTDLAFANVSEDFEGSPVEPTSLARNRVCLSGDDGWDCTDISDAEHNSGEIAAADFDADGNLDVAFGNSFTNTGDLLPEFLEVCLGDGAGSFTCSPLGDGVGTGANPEPAEIAIADIDLDGDLDIVVAMHNWMDQVCLGDGTGEFSCSDVDDEIAFTNGVAVADFAGGSPLDLAFTNYATPNRLCSQQDDGTFSCVDISGPFLPSSGVAALPDLSGDGYAELIIVQFDHNDSFDDAIPNVLLLCETDGASMPSCSPIHELDNLPRSISTDDLDGDGDADLIWPGGLTVCLGDGTAEFDCTNVRLDLGFDERGFSLPLNDLDLALLPTGTGTGGS